MTRHIQTSEPHESQSHDTGSLLRDCAKRFAYMPQPFGCKVLLTVFETVLLALEQTSGWRVQGEYLEPVANTLSVLELSYLSDRGIADLLGGQAR